jgi:uncharacterized membrane protein
MAIFNIEVPVLILVVALVCAFLFWLLGTFTHYLRSCRYRVALGTIAFALSGFMGFICMLKLELELAGGWFAQHPISLLVGIAYCGYVLFGFLGCWTAVRIAGRLDSNHTLSVLYTLLEDRKKTNAN